MKFIYFLLILQVMSSLRPSCRDIYTMNKGGGLFLLPNEPFLFAPENHIKFEAYRDGRVSNSLAAYEIGKLDIATNISYKRPGMIWIFEHDKKDYLCLSSIFPGQPEVIKQFLLDKTKVVNLHGSGMMKDLVFSVTKPKTEANPEIADGASNSDLSQGNANDVATTKQMQLADDYVDDDVKSLCVVLFPKKEGSSEEGSTGEPPREDNFLNGDKTPGEVEMSIEMLREDESQREELSKEEENTSIVKKYPKWNTDWGNYLEKHNYSINPAGYNQMGPLPTTPSVPPLDLESRKSLSLAQKVVDRWKRFTSHEKGEGVITEEERIRQIQSGEALLTNIYVKEHKSKGGYKKPLEYQDHILTNPAAGENAKPPPLPPFHPAARSVSSSLPKSPKPLTLIKSVERSRSSQNQRSDNPVKGKSIENQSVTRSDGDVRTRSSDRGLKARVKDWMKKTKASEGDKVGIKKASTCPTRITGSSGKSIDYSRPPQVSPKVLLLLRQGEEGPVSTPRPIHPDLNDNDLYPLFPLLGNA
jgi:hypothetical protein